MKRILATCFFIALCAGWSVAVIVGFVGNARAQGPAQASPSLKLFFIGRRRGNLEPCGCKSRQQSGLQYEAEIYERVAGAAALRLDAGEWTNVEIEPASVDAVKTRYLLRALKLLHYDAVNVGFADVQMSKDYTKSLIEKSLQGGPPLISANIFLKDQPDRLAFAAYRIIKRTLADGRTITIGITGATSFRTAGSPVIPIRALAKAGAGHAPASTPPDSAERDEEKLTRQETSGYLIKPARDGLGPVVAELRPKVNLLVVLYAGSTTSASALAKALPQIDCLIANGGFLESRLAAAKEGAVQMLGVHNYLGREVGLATLRYGSDKKWSLAGDPQYIGVNKTGQPSKTMVDLIGAFKKETRAISVKLPGPGVKQVYNGARPCLPCHRAIYRDWEETAHARAFQILVDRGQQFNPECVKCHVTGYAVANGFYSVNHGPSQSMINVQCEACHGPSKEHAQIQVMLLARAKKGLKPEEYKQMVERAKAILPKKAVPEPLCTQCHTPENDDRFVYAQKILKVSHRGALAGKKGKEKGVARFNAR